METAIIFAGLVIAFAIGSGLQAIAQAIATRRIDISFTGPVRVECERRQ